MKIINNWKQRENRSELRKYESFYLNIFSKMRVNLAVRVFNPIVAHDMVECGNHTTSSTQIYILVFVKSCRVCHDIFCLLKSLTYRYCAFIVIYQSFNQSSTSVSSWIQDHMYIFNEFNWIIQLWIINIL
jgi:hypothetical protein